MIKPDSGLISSLLIHCELIFELSPDGCQVYAASEKKIVSISLALISPHSGSDDKCFLATRL